MLTFQSLSMRKILSLWYHVRLLLLGALVMYIPLKSLLDFTLLTDTRESCSMQQVIAHGFKIRSGGARSHEQWTRM